LDHGYNGNARSNQAPRLRSALSRLSVGPISRPKNHTKHGKAHRHETNSESEKERLLNSLSLDDKQRGYGFQEIWYEQQITWGLLLHTVPNTCYQQQATNMDIALTKNCNVRGEICFAVTDIQIRYKVLGHKDVKA